jgi:beta-1,4-mannosyltransferase
MSPTRVLMSPGPEISNPFISLLIRNLDADVEVITFSWREAFLGRYDVLHVHWPDALLRAPTPMRRVLKYLQLRALLTRNRFRGIRQVWTVHNLTPHEAGGGLRARALSVWESSCTDKVFLSQAASAQVPTDVGTVIKHGDYRDIRDAHREREVLAVTGDLLLFGLLRPYKGIESLVDAISGQHSLRLRILGRPEPSSYADSLRQRAASVEGVQLDFGRVEDAELVEAITAAEIVVLPYQKIYNSGAALMALTLGRPIIVTDSATMRELRDEVGREWVYCLDAPLTAASLTEAVTTLRNSVRAGNPAFIGRDWAAIGHAYSEVYRRTR